MAEKAAPKDQAKKDPFNLAKFIREVRQEVKRVVWPSRKETMVSTIMVLVLILISAVFFTVVDTVIGTAVQYILGLGK